MQKLTIQISQVDPENQPTKVHVNLIEQEWAKGTIDLPFDNNILPVVLKILASTEYREGDYHESGRKWLSDNKILVSDKNNKLHLVQNRQKIIGQRLFTALFGEGDLNKGFFLYKTEADKKNLPIRLEIQFDPDSKLIGAYPWELLHDEDSFIMSEGGSLWRYITMNLPKPIRQISDKLKILLITPRPSDTLVKIELEEGEKIREALKNLEDSGIVQIDILDPPTFDEFSNYLTMNSNENLPHIIHFDSHGAYGRLCQCGQVVTNPGQENCEHCDEYIVGIEAEGYLEFENPHGNREFIGAKEISDQIRQAGYSTEDSTSTEGICLMVLSACKSATALTGDTVFDGIAQRLLRARIPAVIAMQFDIGVKSAARFFGAFYQSIADQNPLVSAVSSGRTSLGSHSGDWFRPVLYMRWQDNEGGRLFDFRPKPPMIDEIVQMEPNEGADWLIKIHQKLSDDRLKIAVDQKEIIKDVVFSIVQEWRENRRGNIFYIHGKKYTGKTTVLKRIAGICDQLKDIQPLVYCLIDYEGQIHSPQALIENIQNELLDKAKNNAELSFNVQEKFVDFYKEPPSQVFSKTTSEPSTFNLTRRLKKCLEEVGCRTVLMFDNVNKMLDENKEWINKILINEFLRESQNVTIVITNGNGYPEDLPNDVKKHDAYNKGSFIDDLLEIAKDEFHIDPLDRNKRDWLIKKSTEDTGQPNWKLIRTILESWLV